MNAKKYFSKALKSQLDKKQDELQRWAAEMGDGDGKTAVPGFDNFVYVKMDDKVLPVFNNRVSVDSGKKIWVGYATEERTLFQVLSTRSESPTGAQGGFAGYAPSSRYRWGGIDPLPAELRAFMPLRIGASKAGGLKIDLYKGYVHNGTDRFYIPRQDLDVSTHVPTTAGKAAFVLITIDDAGTVVQTKGSEVDIADLVRADVPATPANTIFESGAVRVYYGQITPQDATVNTDFVDLRFSGYSAGGYTPPVTDAANDFQVGDGAGSWIKKTLAQTVTILQTLLDSVYLKLSSMSAANALDLTDGGATTLHTHVTAHTWTPTTGGITLGNGSVVASYSKIDKIIFGSILFTLGSTSAITGDVYFSFPATLSVVGTMSVDLFDLGVAAYEGASDATTTNIYARVKKRIGTDYISLSTSLSSTVPFTWGASDFIRIKFWGILP